MKPLLARPIARAAALATAALAWGAPSPAQQPPAPSPAGPNVVAVEPAEAGLGDRITLTVAGLAEVVQQAGGCARVTLFLGGLPLTGLAPERCDPDDGHLGFLLARDDAGDKAWHALLGRPAGFTRTIKITVGSSDTRSFPSDVTRFRLVLVPRRGFYVFVVFGLGVLGLFGALARRSELLRDPHAQPAAGERRPFSLSRCQMAFWFLLVVLAYFFQWLMTGELDTITDSVLALIGISSATALGATMIDAGKSAGAADNARRLAAEQSALATQAAAGGAPGAGLPVRSARLAEIDARLAAQLAPVKGGSTGNLLTDVLSDPAGISIQRFQMFVWTIVLGLIFCGSVYRSLQMPDFSPTLLALMGISSGTYLGFKFPENYGAQPPGQGAGTTS